LIVSIVKWYQRPRRNHYYHLLSLTSCLARNHTAGVGSTVLKSFLETGFPGMTAYLPHFFLPWLYRSAYLLYAVGFLFPLFPDMFRTMCEYWSMKRSVLVPLYQRNNEVKYLKCNTIERSYKCAITGSAPSQSSTAYSTPNKT
jgi:hypothetical protein